jgi:hypothetical protein
VRGAAASVHCPRCDEPSPPPAGAFVQCRKCGLSFDPDPDRVPSTERPAHAPVHAPPRYIRVHADSKDVLRLSWPYKDTRLIVGISSLALAALLAARILGDDAPNASLVIAAFVIAALGFPIALFQRMTLTIADGSLEVTRRLPSAPSLTLTLSEIERVSIEELVASRGRGSHRVALALRDGSRVALTEVDAAEAEYLEQRVAERLR